MPSVSDKQALAMQIAAAGKSNIGIPQSVGKEFHKADMAAGKHVGKKGGAKSKGSPVGPHERPSTKQGMAAHASYRHGGKGGKAPKY